MTTTEKAIREQAKVIVKYYADNNNSRKAAFEAAKADGVLNGDFGHIVGLYFEIAYPGKHTNK